MNERAAAAKSHALQRVREKWLVVRIEGEGGVELAVGCIDLRHAFPRGSHYIEVWCILTDLAGMVNQAFGVRRRPRRHVLSAFIKVAQIDHQIEVHRQHQLACVTCERREVAAAIQAPLPHVTALDVPTPAEVAEINERGHYISPIGRTSASVRFAKMPRAKRYRDLDPFLSIRQLAAKPMLGCGQMPDTRLRPMPSECMLCTSHNSFGEAASRSY
ncbi:hypothetical protein NOVOSPHI9U_260165 [Novosphingobium sp. 9U]|nr:hypothetical protein NOVOSPHI9U_260165 [Novosphingobium sp. 9U]